MKLPWGRTEPKPGNSTWMLVLSDSHGGHKKGLLHPEVEQEDWGPDGTTTRYIQALTAEQESLWHEVYVPGIEQFKELAGDAPKVAIHNGDPTWGDKHKGALVAMSQANQVAIAAKNFSLFLEMSGLQVFRLTASTESHVYGENSADLLIARDLSQKFPAVDTKLVLHGLANIQGRTVDYSHHGPYPGSRVWLRGNEVRYYLRDIMMRHLMAGKQPPDLVLRSHFHEYVEETLTIRVNGVSHRSRIIITPPLMFPTDYARMRTRSLDTATVGMVAIEFRDGEIQWPPHELTKSYDIRTKEAL